MPRYLYRTKATRPGMLTEPTDHEAEVVSRHFDYLAANATEGVVLVAGRTQTTGEDTFGIVIFEAPDAAAAAGFMRNDPAVIGAVMSAEVFPYRVAIGGHVAEG
jgi:uncharacterized protein YciI